MVFRNASIGSPESQHGVDAVEKGICEVALSNIDSRRASSAQDRFKKLAPLIRLLRIPILQFFRGDFFNSIGQYR